jgi:hypothetical protein
MFTTRSQGLARTRRIDHLATRRSQDSRVLSIQADRLRAHQFPAEQSRRNVEIYRTACRGARSARPGAALLH